MKDIMKDPEEAYKSYVIMYIMDVVCAVALCLFTIGLIKEFETGIFAFYCALFGNFLLLLYSTYSLYKKLKKWADENDIDLKFNLLSRD